MQKIWIETMNSQQLKDLAKQAGFITYAGPDIHVPEDPYGDGCAAELEKFAELIIKDCCNLLEKQGNNWLEFAKTPLEGHVHQTTAALFTAFRLKEDAVDEIKEHFGVEL